MGSTGEANKAEMAAAGVILGLFPTLLCLGGASTAEMNFLYLKRPLLAFLLSASSCAVWPARACETKSPLELLERSPGTKPVQAPSGPWRHVISALQYLLARGAVANVAAVTSQLCVQTGFVYRKRIEVANDRPCRSLSFSSSTNSTAAHGYGL